MSQPPPQWQPQPQHAGPQQYGPQQYSPPPQQGWHQHPSQPLPHQPHPHPQQQWQGPPPQQQWHGPPPQQQGPAGAGLWTHVRRAVDWNVAQVRVSPKERQSLEAAGVYDRLQGLFAWRRSSLMVALPVLLLSVILSFVTAAQDDLDVLSPLGKVVQFTPSIALLFVPVGAAVVLGRWTELRRSSRVLLVCWMVSIVLPLVAALVPSELLYSDETLANVDPLRLQTVKLILAVHYALLLLPVVLSVPSGMLKGAARVKSLFPSSGLPGWFLVSIAPFYSMFVVVVFVLIEQLVGNAALVTGVALLAFSPWLFVIYRKVYSRPLSLAEAKGELARASRLGGYVMWAAIFFIVVFLFIGKVGDSRVVGTGDDAIFSVLDVSRTTVEVLARGIVTAVVFSTIFLGMIFAEWRTMSVMREDIRREHDREMHGLERYITDPRHGYGDVRLSGTPVQQQPSPR